MYLRLFDTFSHTCYNNSMLPELKNIAIHKSEQAAYIPVLDEDPSFAARFLTKRT